MLRASRTSGRFPTPVGSVDDSIRSPREAHRTLSPRAQPHETRLVPSAWVTRGRGSPAYTSTRCLGRARGARSVRPVRKRSSSCSGTTLATRLRRNLDDPQLPGARRSPRLTPALAEIPSTAPGRRASMRSRAALQPPIRLGPVVARRSARWFRTMLPWLLRRLFLPRQYLSLLSLVTERFRLRTFRDSSSRCRTGILYVFRGPAPHHASVDDRFLPACATRYVFPERSGSISTRLFLQIIDFLREAPAREGDTGGRAARIAPLR